MESWRRFPCLIASAKLELRGLVAPSAGIQHELLTALDQGIATVSFISSLVKSGARGRIRTTDTAIFSRMLYQLSYPGNGLFGLPRRRETE